jgi:hypothetical protein
MQFLQGKAKDTLVGKMATEWIEAGEPMLNPVEKPVNWKSLFNNLKKNTSIRATVPKKSRKAPKVDFTSIQYGTRFQKSTMPNGNGAGRGRRENSKARRSQRQNTSVRARLQTSTSNNDTTWDDNGEEWGKRESWADDVGYDNSGTAERNAAPGWGDDSQWEVDGW